VTTQSRWRVAGALVILILGTRAALLTVDYLLDGATRRYHVEASATLFVLAGLVFRLSVRPRGTSASPSVPSTPVWAVLLCVAASLALYWPALAIGFLSDDFGLLARASRWAIGEVTPMLFRPLPLAVWALLSALHAPPTAWHALNVLLHGTNAYLTMKLAEGWMPGRWPVLAGCLMLAAPLAVEAVAWASGIFDVSATLLVLLAVTFARVYDRAPTPAARASFLLIAPLAMVAKETAVVAGALVLIDAWVRRAIRPVLLRDLAVVVGLAAVFASVRLLGAFGATAPSFSRYVAQRVVFESYGGLAVPWHEQWLTAAPWAAIVSALIVISLLGLFFVTRGNERPRFVVGAAGWVLVSVLPVAPMLFIAPDLQGARYLYLGTPAWAALIAGLAAGLPARLRVIGAAVGVVLVTASAVGVRAHLEPWVAAASGRDRILAAASVHGGIRGCGIVSLTGLPDHVAGAYLFRNGTAEAFAPLGLVVRPDAAPGCLFVWNEATGQFQ
jgi:hypothetical protein